jgi:hypothetical protein
MPVIVRIKLFSVQFQLKLPAKTELGNKYVLSRVGAAGAAYAYLFIYLFISKDRQF